MGKIEDLESLQHLREIGALTEVEFEIEKKSILNGNSNINITNKTTKQQEDNGINKEKGKVIIHSYDEFYIVDPNVNVYINDNLITSLSKGQTYEYPITETTKITFKSSIRTTSVTVKPNVITEIRLIWNRATGSLETVCNEQNFNGVNNTINEQTYQSKLNSKKKFDKIWMVIGITVLIIGLIIGLFFVFKDSIIGWYKDPSWNKNNIYTEQKQTNDTYNVKKIDDSKDVVYTLTNKSYPIINISSPEIEDINEKVKREYKENEEYFNHEYNYYLNNEILSLVISIEDTSGYTEYEVYNINVNTGKPVSNTNILKTKDIDEQTFLSNLTICYKEKFLELWEYAKDWNDDYMDAYNKTISTANYNTQVPMFLDNNR